MENNLRLVDIMFRVVVYFIRRIKILSVFAIVGLAIGIVFQYTATSKFKGTMTAISAVVPRAIFEDVMDPVITACSASDTKRKCSLLGIEEAVAESIVAIEILPDEEVKIINDLDKEYENNIINVEVTVYDPDLLPAIQEAILSYLENNPYISAKLKQKQTLIAASLDEINHQIVLLDSAQNLSLHLLSQGQVKEYISFNASTATPQAEAVNLVESRGILLELQSQLKPAVPITNLSDTVEQSNNTILKIGVFLFTALLMGVVFVSLQKAIMMARNESL